MAAGARAMVAAGEVMAADTGAAEVMAADTGAVIADGVAAGDGTAVVAAGGGHLISLCRISMWRSGVTVNTP
jgi:hypothetical protein